MKLKVGMKIMVNCPGDKYHNEICIINNLSDRLSSKLIKEILPYKRKRLKINLP